MVEKRSLGYEKAIAAMNMMLDGFCDHTAMIADDIIGTEVKNVSSSRIGRKGNEPYEDGTW